MELDEIKITFGIITTKESCHNLEKIIDSVESQGIPEEFYEIIVVGNCNNLERRNLKKIDFDESIKKSWITRKKNIISKESKHDIIVYMHDYLYLSDNWYKEFINFGLEWDLCMNRIENPDGSRILDWMGLPDDPIYGNVVFPYDYKGSQGMYVPGYFWVAKKELMINHPLNEDFVWGEGEDVEWSKRVIGGFPPPWLKKSKELVFNKNKVRYVVNEKCTIKSIKMKHFSNDFFSKYDMHSGDESRPKKSTPENYKYIEKRNEKINNF